MREKVRKVEKTGKEELERKAGKGTSGKGTSKACRRASVESGQKKRAVNQAVTAGGGRPDGGRPIRKGPREVWNGATSKCGQWRVEWKRSKASKNKDVLKRI